MIFEPPDFIARLAVLVPKPRVNLTRLHGVFAPNSKHRALVTKAARGKRKQAKGSDEPVPAERRASMTWAQRLKRVFNIDIETCGECGGPVQVIVEASHRSIKDPVVIQKILDHPAFAGSVTPLGSIKDRYEVPLIVAGDGLQKGVVSVTGAHHDLPSTLGGLLGMDRLPCDRGLDLLAIDGVVVPRSTPDVR